MVGVHDPFVLNRAKDRLLKIRSISVFFVSRKFSLLKFSSLRCVNIADKTCLASSATQAPFLDLLANFLQHFERLILRLHRVKDIVLVLLNLFL